MSAPRGFTLIELVVVVVVVALLAANLFSRLLFYQEQAEKVSMDSTLAAIRSGLQLELARKLLQEGRKNLAVMALQNPLDLLAEPPPNYRGTRKDFGGRLERGVWYFDDERRELVYLPKIDTNLMLDSADKALRFRVEVLDGSGDPPTLGVRLVPGTIYKWF